MSEQRNKSDEYEMTEHFADALLEEVREGEYGEEAIEELEELAPELDALLQPLLKEGICCYCDPYIYDNSQSGGSPYHIVDGEASYKGMEEIKEALDDSRVFFCLCQELPLNRKYRFTFRKGSPFSVQAYTPAMLIREIEGEFLSLLSSGRTSIIADYEFHPGRGGGIKSHGKSVQIIDGERQSKDPCLTAFQELETLCSTLGGNLKKLRILCDHQGFRIFASPAYPEWDLPPLPQDDVADLDGRDRKAVFAYLESGEDQKIAKAMEALECHPETRKAAESRYLNLLRSRTGNASASLAQFPTAAFSGKDDSLLSGRALGKETLSFSYMDDSDTRLIVDFTGSLVKNHLDMDSFVEAAREASDEEALVELIEKTEKKVRRGIEEEIREYPEGWYGRAASRFLEMKLEKVLFEKTAFGWANASAVLREYMFFLGMISTGRLYLDIHQSDTPTLTEIFWMMKHVPETNWSDVEPEIPTNPLAFPRKGRMRVGDMGEWVSFEKGEERNG